MSARAGLGLRVKTARAIAIALAGDPRAPSQVVRCELRLSDPDVPESSQPWHAGLGLAPDQARVVVGHACEAVERASEASLRDWLEALAADGLRPAAAVLVRSTDTDPARVRSPHMHAHAAEGRLFYDALRDAARRCALETAGLLEKRALDEVARGLDRTTRAVRDHVAALGKALGPPWRADEKAACAAAWLALAGRLAAS